MCRVSGAPLVYRGVPRLAQPDVVIRMMASKNEWDAGNPRSNQTDERGIKAVSVEHGHAVSAEQARQVHDSSRILPSGCRAE